jgi:hypothetical protein
MALALEQHGVVFKNATFLCAENFLTMSGPLWAK